MAPSASKLIIIIKLTAIDHRCAEMKQVIQTRRPNKQYRDCRDQPTLRTKNISRVDTRDVLHWSDITLDWTYLRFTLKINGVRGAGFLNLARDTRCVKRDACLLTPSLSSKDFIETFRSGNMLLISEVRKPATKDAYCFKGSVEMFLTSTTTGPEGGAGPLHLFSTFLWRLSNNTILLLYPVVFQYSTSESVSITELRGVVNILKEYHSRGHFRIATYYCASIVGLLDSGTRGC